MSEMDSQKARVLVGAWASATAEQKANPRCYGPMTRAVTAQAFSALGMPVPPELEGG